MALPNSPAPSVVLIDDNLLFSAGIESALRRLGCRVRVLPGGPGTADRIAADAPAFVLLNLAAARGESLELLRALRAHPALPGLRILAFTGHLETGTIHAAREAGADQVLANSAVAGHLETVLRKAGLLADEHSTTPSLRSPHPAPLLAIVPGQDPVHEVREEGLEGVRG